MSKRIEGGFGAVLRFGLLPLALYFVLFCALTYPLITRFSAGFWADTGDGMQNVWNLWWVKRCLTQTHEFPWLTHWLHYPYGVTLIGHTLNPFNGVLAIPLSLFLNQEQTYNAVVIFSYVVGGWTAFLLAHRFTGSYFGSLFGGALFTFSSYHFSISQGNLQLIALEWIPLFLLCWDRFLSRPSTGTAAAAAGSLFLVITCDFYYFFVSALTAAAMVAWYWYRDLHFVPRLHAHRWRSVKVFLLLAGLTSGALSLWLAVASALDPYVLGGHPAEIFSEDLVALVVPGQYWRFNDLTQPLWTHFGLGNYHLGFGICLLLLYLLWSRRELKGTGLGFWTGVFLVFTALSLGPLLHVGGFKWESVPMPYSLGEAVFPIIKLGGVPSRFIVMALVALAVLAAAGMERLARECGWARWIGPVVLVLIVLESVPRLPPVTRMAIPAQIAYLKQLPGQEAVLDLQHELGPGIFYQTVYQRPQAMGYVSRVPHSVHLQDNQLNRLVHAHEWSELYRRYGIRYLITAPGARAEEQDPRVKAVFRCGEGELYDLRPP